MGFPGQRAPRQVHRVSLSIPSSFLLIVNSLQSARLLVVSGAFSRRVRITQPRQALLLSERTRQNRNATPSKAIFQVAMYRRVVFRVVA